MSGGWRGCLKDRRTTENYKSPFNFCTEITKHDGKYVFLSYYRLFNSCINKAWISSAGREKYKCNVVYEIVYPDFSCGRLSIYFFKTIFQQLTKIC